MIQNVLQLLKLIFTAYFVGLVIICGFILSFLYPFLIDQAETEFKKEYKVGRIVGYLYIAGSLVVFLIVKLFG